MTRGKQIKKKKQEKIKKIKYGIVAAAKVGLHQHGGQSESLKAILDAYCDGLVEGGYARCGKSKLSVAVPSV